MFLLSDLTQKINKTSKHKRKKRRKEKKKDFDLDDYESWFGIKARNRGCWLWFLVREFFVMGVGFGLKCGESSVEQWGGCGAWRDWGGGSNWQWWWGLRKVRRWRQLLNLGFDQAGVWIPIVFLLELVLGLGCLILVNFNNSDFACFCFWPSNAQIRPSNAQIQPGFQILCCKIFE